MGQNRRLLAVVAGVAAVLLLAAVAVAVVRSGGDDKSSSSTIPRAAAGAGSSSATAPPPPGKELVLLNKRVVVAARPGWEQREASNDTATVQLALADPGKRELLSTLVIAFLPGAGSLDATLSRPGGSGFEAPSASGPLKATAVPGPSATVVAGIIRPTGMFFLSLSIFALDGSTLDVPVLKKLFTEQVAPALRFP